MLTILKITLRDRQNNLIKIYNIIVNNMTQREFPFKHEEKNREGTIYDIIQNVYYAFDNSNTY